MRGCAVGLVLALAVGAAAAAWGERGGGTARTADTSPSEVLREWAIRARALRLVGEHAPPLAAVPAPDGAFLGEGWRGERSAVEALRRARRFVDVPAPGALTSGVAARPELAAVAIAGSHPAEAADAIERGLASSFGAARAAAADRLARALFEVPALRARPFPAPAEGRDVDAAEAVARARARAGLAGGAVPAWLAAEAAIGATPGDALDARFDDLVRAPLDALAIEDLRRGGAGPLAEVLAAVAAARDGAGVEVREAPIRAWLEAGALDFELASALFGAADAAARAGHPGVGAPVGEIALDLARRGRRDLVEVAARLLPLERAVGAARGLDDPALRAAFGEALEAREVRLDARPFASWLEEDLAGGREDAAWLLELASRRYQYGGQPDFGALLARAVLAGDAWSAEHRASTLARLGDLTRASSSGRYADAVAAAYRAAPPEARADVIARLYPGPGTHALAPALVGWLDALPGRAPPRNTFEVAARARSEAVEAALLGALQRAVAGLVSASSGVDTAARTEALVQQCGEALLSSGRDPAVGGAVAAEIARIHAARSGPPPGCLSPLLERLAGGAAGELPALAPLLAEDVDGELRGRAAEAIVRGAANAEREGAPHDASLAVEAAAVLVDALVRESGSPGGQPIGRTTAMFRAASLAPPAHLSRAAVLRILDAGLASSRTPLALLALDLAAERGEFGVLVQALEAPARDPLTGERALALGRAALRGLDRAWRRARPSERDAASAARLLGDLATMPPSEEDEGDYAVELLRGEAIAAAIRLRGADIDGAGLDGAARGALGRVATALFDASLARAARATRARLEGREQAAVLITPDPCVRGFEALGAAPGAQRAALMERPEVLARLDARVLGELARAAVDPDVAVALLVAADVAREGERPGREADRREAAGAVALLRAAREAEGDGAATLARGATATLLGRMRSGAVSPRVVGLELAGPLVGGGADALALVAAEAWRGREPGAPLERALRSAFLRCEPAPR